MARGHVVAVPAGILACALCESANSPVALRAWTRLHAFFLSTREHNRAAYVCRDCARAEATRALLATALFGWWSLQSVLLLAPRATIRNWRAVFTHPADPGRCGAISASDFRCRFLAPAPTPAADERLWDSPLLLLDRAQLALVSDAEGLYELLGVAPQETTGAVQRAYRVRCKELHPDMNGGEENATELMAQLNNAWEILRDPTLRAAYDWLQAERTADREAVAV